MTEKVGLRIELEFFHARFQLVVIVRIHGINRGKNHGFDFAETGQWFETRTIHVSDRIADAHVRDGLYARDDVADLAGGQFFLFDQCDLEDTDRLHLVLGIVGHEAELHAPPESSGEDPKMDDDASVRIVMAVENEGAEHIGSQALGGRYALHDRFEQFVDSGALLGRYEHRSVGIQAEIVVDLVLGAGDIGRGHVYLVDDRDDFKVVLEGEVKIGKRLGLDALGGVHQEQRTFAGRNGSGNFVSEIDVARGIDEIELVVDAVGGGVRNRDRLALDGYAALALDVHVVEDLVLEIPVIDYVRLLYEAIREGGFSVVDMGNDAEIANAGRFRHSVGL